MTIMSPDSNVIADTRLKNLYFLVEATDFEQQCLWRLYSKGAGEFAYPSYIKVDWSGGDGYLPTAGHLNNSPVCFSLRLIKLNGKYVAFWNATGQVVDHELIKSWLLRNTSTPDNKQVRQIDASTFDEVVGTF